MLGALINTAGLSIAISMLYFWWVGKALHPGLLSVSIAGAALASVLTIFLARRLLCRSPV
jgi:hypothetical protein